MAPQTDRLPAATWPLTLVGLLVTLILIGVEIPAVHNHGGDAPGLFNEECLLERLAAGVPGATLPHVPTAPQWMPAAPLLAPPPAAAGLPVTRPVSEARAPPNTA